MYEKMLEDLEQAENFIFLEYFIVEEGVINLADEYINSVQKYGHWKDGGYSS